MRRVPTLAMAALGCVWFAAQARAATSVLIVQGLGGEAQYSEEFTQQGRALARDAATLTDSAHVDVLEGPAATRDALRAALRELKSSLGAEDRFVLYLVGHGSYDGQDYKFNLPGPDITARELATLLDALPAPRQLIVATGSASGALADVLARPQRLVMTGTRSGNEKNATRFGAALVKALDDAGTDRDRSETLSVQEVFDAASRDIKESFERDKKLATEHPRLQGDAADQFTLKRGAASAAANASAAAQAAQGAAGAADTPGAVVAPALQVERTALNDRIEALRLKKEQLPEAEYRQQLEALLLQLAELQERIDAQSETNPSGASPPEKIQ
ncbi:MAG: hypothetical protein QM718_08965 [Steroidobacteraceae bacterium]